MTPFQQFRLWARRAPAGERVLAAVGAGLAALAIGWLLVPASDTGPTETVLSGSSGTASPGTASSELGSAAAAPEQSAGGATAEAGGATTASTVAAAGGATGAAANRTTDGGCVSPPGSDQGITATHIKIAILMFNIAGPDTANEAFGLPSVSMQKELWELGFKYINDSGGVACRKLVPLFYTVNPYDQNQWQATCLDVVEAKPFIVIDQAAIYPAFLACYPQHQLPFLNGSQISKLELEKYYPYVFAVGEWDRAYRNTVMALNQRGFFSPENGFKKLGYFYQDCDPEIPGKFQGWLGELGLTSDKVVTQNLGCPGIYGNAANVQQAVLKFQQNGVTHVTQTGATGDFITFTKVAEQQRYRPKYGIPDEGIAAVSYGTNPPDYNNLVDAIAITNARYAEERTPNYAPSPGTVKCNAFMTANGQKPSYQQPLGQGGTTCNFVWLIAAMVNHAPSLQRTSLAAGLQAAKSIDYSYPWGPGDYTGPRVTVSGQFWRPFQFMKNCNCWTVIDANFKPSFR